LTHAQRKEAISIAGEGSFGDLSSLLQRGLAGEKAWLDGSTFWRTADLSETWHTELLLGVPLSRKTETSLRGDKKEGNVAGEGSANMGGGISVGKRGSRDREEVQKFLRFLQEELKRGLRDRRASSGLEQNESSSGRSTEEPVPCREDAPEEKGEDGKEEQQIGGVVPSLRKEKEEGRICYHPSGDSQGKPTERNPLEKSVTSASGSMPLLRRGVTARQRTELLRFLQNTLAHIVHTGD